MASTGAAQGLVGWACCSRWQSSSRVAPSNDVYRRAVGKAHGDAAGSGVGGHTPRWLTGGRFSIASAVALMRSGRGGAQRKAWRSCSGRWMCHMWLRQEWRRCLGGRGNAGPRTREPGSASKAKQWLEIAPTKPNTSMAACNCCVLMHRPWLLAPCRHWRHCLGKRWFS